MVAQTRLIVTLYVRTLPVLFFVQGLWMGS